MPKIAVMGAKRKVISWTADDNIDPAEDLPSSRLANVAHELGQHNGVNISVEMSDTYVFNSPEQMTAATTGDLGPDAGVYYYSRSFNPTVEVLGRHMAALEATETAYCTASGLSAIAATIIHLCKSGGHVVAAETIYAGAFNLLTKFLAPKCNVTTTFVDITNLKAVDEAMVAGRTNLLYFETVANPALIVANIPELSKLAHQKGIQVVVDNTFTCMVVSPAQLGADIVIQSMTKFVSGESDCMAGAICGSTELIKAITDEGAGVLMMLGPVMAPLEAFNLLGRLAHCGIRVKKQCTRTLKLAKRIKEEYGLKVVYPGLEDHPEHKLLDSMRNKGYGFGAVFCIDMGTTDKAYNLMRGLCKYKFGFLAVSLGYKEILMSCPGATSSSESSKMLTRRAHMSPGYIRVCVGYVGTLAQKWDQFKMAMFDMGA